MLWMGIWWVHPYADTSEGEWWIFGNYGQWLSLSDVVRSWLRLQLPRECIPWPCHIYTKCFSTLRCCGWAYGCTLMLICLLRWMVDFCMAESEWCCGSRLQTPIDSIPQPYHIYKVFYHLDILWMSIWDGCTLTLHCNTTCQGQTRKIKELLS